MKKLGKELEFISLIKRDGSGVVPIGSDWDNQSFTPKTDIIDYMDNELFEVRCLSLSYKTFIAIGFNSFVVKIKKT